jgi:hypothetical protein
LDKRMFTSSAICSARAKRLVFSSLMRAEDATIANSVHLKLGNCLILKRMSSKKEENSRRLRAYQRPIDCPSVVTLDEMRFGLLSFRPVSTGDVQTFGGAVPPCGTRGTKGTYGIAYPADSTADCCSGSCAIDCLRRRGAGLSGGGRSHRHAERFTVNQSDGGRKRNRDRVGFGGNLCRIRSGV